MINDSSTNAQTRDLSVKTIELTNVRSALMNPWHEAQLFFLAFFL